MSKASDYHIDGNQSLVTFAGDLGEHIAVFSGGLSCSKCGRKIPDKEMMFCIPCFGETVQPRARAKKPKPDEGGLFEEEVGEMHGEQDT